MTRHTLLGEDLPASASVAMTALGVAACTLWLVLAGRNATQTAPRAVESSAHALTAQRVAPPPPAAFAPPVAGAPSATSPLIAADSARPATRASADPAQLCPPLVIGFPRAASHVTPEDAQRLAQLADKLSADPSATLLVRGHADGLGSDAYNLALSFQRGEAVAHALVSHGVARGRISVQGFGEYAPLDGTTPAQAVNRRATVDVRGARVCPREDGPP